VSSKKFGYSARSKLKNATNSYLRPNAARKIAAIIINKPAMMAMNPSEIRNPPNGVLGPHGPNPDAKVSANATMPIMKEMAPPVASFFTLLIYQGMPAYACCKLRFEIR
jgi:hypothetical protein